MSFSELGLDTELLRAVSDEGYTKPTPVQQQSIPVILKGRDIMAGAQTGTGKTAGFTLPLLQILSVQRHKRAPRALILVPTRELAAQVQESVETYGRYLRLKSAVVFGGVSINPQVKQLRQGIDILVATPGRLLDHVNQKSVDLSQIEILVLDEADRMLDMGFIRDIRRIIGLLPGKRQNLLFSATFPKEIKQLANTLLQDPVEIEIARNDIAANAIEQRIHYVDKDRKRELLSHMIGANRWEQVLVFARTRHGANRLSKQLAKDGIKTAAIHGDKSQGARTRALADFKAGKVQTLVATDVAARGIDIDQLPHVVNFDLPDVAEDYVHRIGRTGRAGAGGIAISLVSADELKQLSGIEKLLKRDLPKTTIEGYEPSGAVLQLQQNRKKSDRNSSGSRRSYGRGSGGRRLRPSLGSARG